MLSDAKQRNDVLSQAYAALHAEYVSLKSSQIGDASYPPQYSSMPYGGAGSSSAPGSMGLNAVSGVDGLEGIDMYVYGDLNTAGYTL
jgi:hypothetical protein